MPHINDAIHRLEYNLQQQNDVNNAYETFTKLVTDEMEKTLPKRNISERQSCPKTKYKPYWCDELQTAWDLVRAKERAWLRSTGNQSEKRRIRNAYIGE